MGMKRLNYSWFAKRRLRDTELVKENCYNQAMEREKIKEVWGVMNAIFLPAFWVTGSLELMSVLGEGEGQPWLSLGLVAIGLLAVSSWRTGKEVLKRQEKESRLVGGDGVEDGSLRV